MTAFFFLVSKRPRDKSYKWLPLGNRRSQQDAMTKYQRPNLLMKSLQDWMPKRKKEQYRRKRFRLATKTKVAWREHALWQTVIKKIVSSRKSPSGMRFQQLLARYGSCKPKGKKAVNRQFRLNVFLRIDERLTKYQRNNWWQAKHWKHWQCKKSHEELSAYIFHSTICQIKRYSRWLDNRNFWYFRTNLKIPFIEFSFHSCICRLHLVLVVCFFLWLFSFSFFFFFN